MYGVFKSAALITLSTALSGCGMGMDHFDNRSTGPANFTSNGERIYFTGVGRDDSPISTSGGNMHHDMHSSGCVSCHGADRQGGERMYPFFWIQSPALTADALFGDHDDGHGDHSSYSSTSLRRAIREGVDPNGEALDSSMPRWVMGEQDLNDLVRYLRGEGIASH
ncbi:MAG: c-type cytochrome [Motiliproteus sp.]